MERALLIFYTVSNLLLRLHQPSNPALTAPFITMYSKILRSLCVQCEGDQSRFRSFRPPSPVKILSNILGSGGSFSSPSSAAKQRNLLMAGVTPNLAPPVRPASRGGSQKGRILEDVTQQHSTIVAGAAPNPPKSLEDTLATYVLALHERKGNVTGTLLRNRALADELAVNEVYNTLCRTFLP
jgi:hypothetical protein